jgi:hypothetical protein
VRATETASDPAISRAAPTAHSATTSAPVTGIRSAAAVLAATVTAFVDFVVVAPGSVGAAGAIRDTAGRIAVALAARASDSSMPWESAFQSGVTSPVVVDAVVVDPAVVDPAVVDPVVVDPANGRLTAAAAGTAETVATIADMSAAAASRRAAVPRNVLAVADRIARPSRGARAARLPLRIVAAPAGEGFAARAATSTQSTHPPP